MPGNASMICYHLKYRASIQMHNMKCENRTNYSYLESVSELHV